MGKTVRTADIGMILSYCYKTVNFSVLFMIFIYVSLVIKRLL